MELVSYHIEICSRLPFLPFQEFETTSPQPQRRIYPDSFQQHLHVSTASLAFVKTFRPERFLRVRGSSYFVREMESSRGRRGFVPVTNDPRDENTRKGYVAECTDDGSVTGATHRPSPTSSRVIKFTQHPERAAPSREVETIVRRRSPFVPPPFLIETNNRAYPLVFTHVSFRHYIASFGV